MSKDDYDPPALEPTGSDAAHSIARAGLSALPLVGGPATELLNTVLAPPLIRRQQQWREKIAEAVRRIEERQGLDLEALGENDVFVDAVMKASDVALRTSQEEKLSALKAAIENSVSSDSPDQARQELFLSWVDQITVWHLRLLKLFDDPPAWFSAQNRAMAERAISSSLSGVLEEAFPDLRGRRDFYDQVWRDLHVRGLINTDSLHAMMTPSGASARRTTDLGHQFLEFITSKK